MHDLTGESFHGLLHLPSCGPDGLSIDAVIRFVVPLKGLLDVVAERLATMGFVYFVVDFGGDPYSVDLEHCLRPLVG